MQFSIFDPTGNITALVESEVSPAERPAIAAEIQRRRPAVEQVGFLRIDPEAPEAAQLDMAGGEFCGNAAMSAAALCLLRRGECGAEETLRLRVSGAAQRVAVRLRRVDEHAFYAQVRMPPVQRVAETGLAFGDERGTLPIVYMEGIVHAVIEPDSVFWSLQLDRPSAERAVRGWCAALGAEALGLMFYDPAEGSLMPLVSVPGSGTVCWENSCASGTAAVGIALAKRTGAHVDLALREPGGTLRIECDPARREAKLSGAVRLLEQVNV